MNEKLKRYWKHIILIIVGGYFGVTIIATALGYERIKKQQHAMENHETEIGKEFVKQKDDFHERFYSSMLETLNSMEAHFARTEKRSDLNAINKMKEGLVIRQERGDDPSSTKLFAYYLSMAEKAFDKKWTPQESNETEAQYKRRVDEGRFDWDQIRLKRRENMEKEANGGFLKTWLRIDEVRDLFEKRKEQFFSDYGDDYKGILEEKPYDANIE